MGTTMTPGTQSDCESVVADCPDQCRVAIYYALPLTRMTIWNAYLDIYSGN